MPVSGVPELSGGVWIGVTDFSELSVGAGVPAGMSFIGPAVNPMVFSVANDVTEGNYLIGDNSGASLASQALLYDAFDNLIREGELLARLWMPAVATTNRRVGGACINFSGTDNTDIDAQVGGIYQDTANSDYKSNQLNYVASVGGVLNVGNMSEAEQNGVWFWQRWKKVRTDGTSSDYYVKSWYGLLSAEPGAWDQTNLAQVTGVDVVGGLGIMWPSFPVPAADHRIAFLSFTGDPDIASAPTPEDLAAASVSDTAYATDAPARAVAIPGGNVSDIVITTDSVQTSFPSLLGVSDIVVAADTPSSEHYRRSDSRFILRTSVLDSTIELPPITTTVQP